MAQIQLYCKLAEAVITPEGDFVPKGTPVQVLQWSQKGTNKIDVRAKYYMWSDSEDLTEKSQGFVGQYLIISVDHNQLVYDELAMARQV